MKPTDSSGTMIRERKEMKYSVLESQQKLFVACMRAQSSFNHFFRFLLFSNLIQRCTFPTWYRDVLLLLADNLCLLFGLHSTFCMHASAFKLLSTYTEFFFHTCVNYWLLQVNRGLTLQFPHSNFDLFIFYPNACFILNYLIRIRTFTWSAK